MPEIVQDTLPQQIDRIRFLVAPVLFSPEAEIPPQLTAALLDFHVATKDEPLFEQAGETARSLASLLHHLGSSVPNEQERVQVSVLLESLLQEMVPGEADVHADSRRPLVTPIVPSSPTRNLRIALYVDSVSLLVMLREALAQAGFEPVTFDSLEALAASSGEHCPAAIIADLGLCQLLPESAEIFADLRRRLSPAPHLFCVAASNDIPARLEAVRLGATRFLAQPVDAARLVAVLKGVTIQTPLKPYRVVIVEDDPFLAEVYRDGLESVGVDTCVVNDPLMAPDQIVAFQPDLVVSDLFMPGCNGFELLALLRQDDALADTPILLLSSEPDVERRMEALDLGADDFLTKPVDMSLLISTVMARAKRARTLKRSRSEYRRILQRMREMEPYLPEDFAGRSDTDVEFDTFISETINMDDFIVGEVGKNDPA